MVLRLRETDAKDPLRDITIVHEDHLAPHAAGAIFNPLWIDRIADLRLLRFTDWQLTNGSDQGIDLVIRCCCPWDWSLCTRAHSRRRFHRCCM